MWASIAGESTGGSGDPLEADAERRPVTGGRNAISLRRDPARGYLGGVCAGFGARVGVDPLLIRLGFAATFFAGGVGVPLYIVAWMLIPADGPEKPYVARLVNRRDAWFVAAGIGCLVLAFMLLLRQWGLWFGDSLAWPAAFIAAGGALIWRQADRASCPSSSSRRRSRAGRASARRWWSAAR